MKKNQRIKYILIKYFLPNIVNKRKKLHFVVVLELLVDVKYRQTDLKYEYLTNDIIDQTFIELFERQYPHYTGLQHPRE